MTQRVTTGKKKTLMCSIGKEGDMKKTGYMLLLTGMLALTGCGSQTEQPTQEPAQNVQEDQTNDKAEQPSDDTADDTADQTDETVDAVALLQEKCREIIADMPDARGTWYDVKKSGEAQEYGVIGIMGSVIQDISGDGVEDLVIVRAEDSFSNVYADVYTVENDMVVLKAQNLYLFAGTYEDDAAGAVYLKQTADGWNLVADCASLYSHYADGACGDIQAYDCTDHAYTKLIEYSYAGSELSEEEPVMIEAGQKAGLSVTEAPYARLYAAEDSDVRVFAGYGLYVDQTYNFNTWYDIEYDGSVYGTLTVPMLTTEDFMYDAKLSGDFLSDYAVCGHYADAYTEGEFILPESSVRRLAEDDLEPIANDAEKLRLARNEIYARNGRMFNDQELQDYFSAKSWYLPEVSSEDFDESVLSDIEKYNLKLIKSYEAKLSAGN